MNKPNAAIYYRVSTKQQDEASQRPALEAWARVHASEYAEIRDGYLDKFSGRTMDRPAWKKLEQEYRDGEIQTIVVWRLDRLGRTASGLTRLFGELVSMGVKLVSIHDGFDLDTPTGRLTAHIMASVAQFETECRGERVKAGIAVAKASGKKWGGSKKGRVTSKTLTDEKRDAILKMWRDGGMAGWRDGGMAKAQIARVFGVSEKVVRNLLKEADDEQD